MNTRKKKLIAYVISYRLKSTRSPLGDTEGYPPPKISKKLTPQKIHHNKILLPSPFQGVHTLSVILIFSLIVTFYLTKTENRTKKSLTQLSYYCFE